LDLKKVLETNQQQGVDRIAQGDAQVWQAFLEEQIPRLYGMFMKRWPNPALAEELTQKTVFDAIRGRASFDPDKGCLNEWLFGIGRNNIRMEIRRRAVQGGLNGDMARYFARMGQEALPDELLEKEETAALVRRALAGIEESQRQVLIAKYIEDLSARQIARQTKTTEKAVHSLLYRARRSLRRELERLVPDDVKEQLP
jgi:RNA polymerase sigma factor (sigma-70 family)